MGSVFLAAAGGFHLDATFLGLVAGVVLTLLVLAALIPRAPILDRLEEVLIASLIGLATILIFVAVAQRYSMTASINIANYGKAHEMPWMSEAGRAVFKAMRGLNLTWAQELCIYMFVWMAKFGAALGVRQGIHVGVDVLTNQLGSKAKGIVIPFALFCGAIFTCIVGSLGALFVYNIAQTEQTSADLELPMWFVYLAIPLGSYLMCFRFLQVFFSYMRGNDLPGHGHATVHVPGTKLDEVAV